jgi:hypothetical protein
VTATKYIPFVSCCNYVCNYFCGSDDLVWDNKNKRGRCGEMGSVGMALIAITQEERECNLANEC